MANGGESICCFRSVVSVDMLWFPVFKSMGEDLSVISMVYLMGFSKYSLALCKIGYYVVITIFLLISMEDNRAKYHCICTLRIVIFGKVRMRSAIGLTFIASFLVW